MDILPYIGIVICLAFSAFFSGSEIAYASANKVRLKKAAEVGNKRAKTAYYISEHFDDALTTILIGNNLVNIAASSISTVIAISLMGESGTIVATIVMTIIILTFGEIAPKIIAKQQCDKFVLLVSFPLRFLIYILKPVIVVVVGFVNLVSKLWKKDNNNEPSITEEELVSIIESVEEEGVIDSERSDLLQSALEFSDISVEEILTPRTDMMAININDSMDSIIETVLESPYSRIPVYDDSIDNIIGILHMGRFFRKLVDNKEIDIRSILIDACFVHKTMKLPDLFDELKDRRLQMAIVTDEYGGTMGCITMEDILEELVGDIWDEADEIVNDFKIIDENTYEVSGDLSLRDFFDYVDIDDRDFESDYSTVGGWAMEMIDDIPSIGDTFKYKNLTIKVIELDGMRVTKLAVFVEKEEEESNVV
ncbi:MAG TPA: HlyC/CorC family transporter [Clostridiales bacterium]|nr:HlyC/CorC family transporter [Clostridiales bacterium]